MAIFKVGQRVRVIAAIPTPNAPYIGPEAPETVGCEGTLIGRYIGDGPWHWDMHVDGFGRRVLAVQECEIAPLTDPGSESFMERIKQWGPLHEEPKVGKTFAELRDWALRSINENQ